MKKVLFNIAIVAAGLFVASCGNKNATSTANEGQAEQAAEGFTTYTNDKFGYSVDVPDWMTRHDPEMGDGNGTIYLSNPDDMLDINRIDIGAYNDSFDEAFTPERVKSRFESDIEDLNNVTEKECGDTYYTFTRKSEDSGHITMTKNLFKDKKYVVVTIDYDADKADKLGGNVAKHIFNSITIK